MTNLTVCRTCLQLKPLAEFSKTGDRKSGHLPRCKSCMRDYSRQYSKNNPQQKAAANRAWAQKNLDKKNATTKKWRKNNPEKVAAYKISYRQTNPGVDAATKQAWYKANVVKSAATNKAWYKANPQARINGTAKRRSLKLAGGSYRVTPSELAKMLASGCSYCDTPAKHIDHIIPLSRGGSHSIGNLTGACASCNLSKGAKFLTEWNATTRRKQ